MPLPRKKRPLCGARNRQGKPCAVRVEPGKRRCRFHGGLSTGPKTAAGRERIAEAQRRRWRALSKPAKRLLTPSGSVGRLARALGMYRDKIGVTSDTKQVVPVLVYRGAPEKILARKAGNASPPGTGDRDGDEPKVITFRVTILPSAKIDPTARAAVASISQGVGGELRIKMHDKIPAIDKLARVVGMYRDESNDTSDTKQIVPVLVYTGAPEKILARKVGPMR
jgi:hypothetical protein